MRPRTGLVFIFAIGLLGVIIALAFAMLVASRASYASQRVAQAPELARLAAEEGMDHAIGVIRRQFDDGKAIPTQLNDAWRTHFWPIDALKVDHHLGAGLQKDPLGLAFSPNDAFENDVRYENALTDPYETLLSGGAGYRSPSYAYRSGYLNHPGCARWYEPGVLTADPVARPLSFHLPHPQPASAASPDPAVRAGENWTPDVDRPMWYDSAFVPTDDPARRRYRLRYAVAVEDLAGHLLVAAPGAYDPTAVAAPAGVPSESDRAKVVEVDAVVAARHAGGISNIVRFNHPSSFARAFEFAETGLRGVGLPMATFTYGGVESSAYVVMLAGWKVATPTASHFVRLSDFDRIPETVLPAGEQDYLINGTTQTRDGIDYFSLGPIPSFRKTLWDQQAQNHCWNPFLLTPFGRVPEPVGNPTAWHHGYVDTPWRINLPTAAPRALINMVYGYMPGEFLTRMFYKRKVEEWNAVTKSWVGKPAADDLRPLPSNAHTMELPYVRLFREAGKHASPPWFADRGGISPASPYPGTDATDRGGWDADLGKDVLANGLLGAACSSLVGQGNNFFESTAAATQWTTGYGSDGYTLQESKDPVVLDGASKHVSGGRISYPFEKYETTPPTPPHPWTGYSQGGVPFNEFGCYWFKDSYWLDLHVAMLQALALAHFAWTDAVPGAYAGDPDAGKARWPATLPPGYFPAPAAAGALARDRDVDGDGTRDVPSAFDTVREVDAQFVRNLGEDPAVWATGTRPIAPATALRIRQSANWYTPPIIEPVDYKTARTKSIEVPDPLPTDPTHTKWITVPDPALTIKSIRLAGRTDQAGLMELVLNDMRMSFFGASPDYADFQPLDFDDDGTVRCSCYMGGAVPSGSVGTTAMRRFSLTGYMDFQKSRYYRIIVRGEVFDEVRGIAVAQDNLESVYVVDPDGDVVDRRLVHRPAAARTTGMSDSHVLYQRHLRNRYLGLRSSVER